MSDATKVKLLMVGCGNMGEAILRGVLAAGQLRADEIAVAEPVAERRALLAGDLGVAVCADLAEAPAAAAVLLAVKPQQMDGVLDALAAWLAAKAPGGALVISIAAGVSTARIAERVAAGLPAGAAAPRLVRAMPNTPMLAGCGCTGLCAGPGAQAPDVDFASAVFAAAGEVCRVEEPDMDAVTAVSGSGPAYFFYLIEAMAAAGVAEGLAPGTALQLAVKTCEGAARLLQQTKLDPAELRRRVTSPGGTTQAAIESLDAAKVRTALEQAVIAAATRSRFLK